MRQIKKFTEKILCFDFDGTITATDMYPLIDENYNKDVVELINRVKFKYTIIINSSRDTLSYNDIERYLTENCIYYDQIHLKCKPTADFYIDDKSFISDVDTMEMFIESMFFNTVDYCKAIGSGELDSKFIKNINNVPENPDFVVKSDTSYRAILPITGGMDSITLWKMLDEAKTPYELYYINMGQDYAKNEIETIEKIVGKPPKIIDIDITFKQYKHILTGRNAIIILMLAEEMKKNNWWGDIWFGNLQGESPIIDGDKSQRFFHDINKLLVLHNYDVRVCNPLIGLDKFDEVSYWLSRNIDQFKLTRSCFSTTEKECGMCQSCFRKYIAFKYFDIDISDQFEVLQFTDHIKKYTDVMNKALENNDFTHYSKERILKTLKIINLIENNE